MNHQIEECEPFEITWSSWRREAQVVVADFDRESGEELFAPKVLLPKDMAVKLREKEEKIETLEISAILKQRNIVSDLHSYLGFEFSVVNDRRSNYYL